ncbi:MAG: hypothetical protein KDA61_07415, partial [Planctomycetales bacterium]|nr:hypothetical protein [Planctomycetales bacterium]
TQSPLLIPDDCGSYSAEKTLQYLFGAWQRKHGLSVVGDLRDAACWAVAGLRFGWSRRQSVNGKATIPGRIGAQRVIEPGAVIRLPRQLSDDELQTLALGIGEGRTQGFGAVTLHPGKAVGMYEAPRAMPIRGEKSLAEAVKLALEISRRKLPSPSQLAALRNERMQGVDQAKTYLNRQVNERTNRVWSTWEGLKADLFKTLELSDELSITALTVLWHKAATKREEDLQ